jgi:V8-like Glu-specific endopeptidase
MRARILGSVLCALTAAACGTLDEDGAAPDEAHLGETQSKVVYGTDNRTDVYAHADATLRARAQQATVALMSPGSINTTDPNNVTFNSETLQQAFGLCSDQRFLTDPTPAFCSGTLIDDNLVLTAGHCITNQSSCNSTRFVFKFYRPAAGALETITTADIFSCTQIVARQQTSTVDYAIVRIDRAATPRFTPAPVRAGNAALPNGTSVTVIGSGSGIPFKIDSGGSVRDARAGTLDYFVANTDTFGGNSGSGVYENAGYTVAGILVRGETDYVARGSCNVVNVCTETGCSGEDITYVRPAVAAYCAVAASARLCGTTEPPPTSSYSYSATNTNSARRNTVNKTVALTAGQRITLGTCGLPGATFTGDTFLRLYNASGTQVANNDDGCGGVGSSITFTATTAGNYEIRGGCFQNSACTGTVAWTIQ